MATKGYMRKPGARQPRKRTAIFTEGEVTEVEYLKYLVSRLGIPKELVEFFPSEHTDPKGLVNDAVAAKDLNRSRAKRKKEGLIENWWVLVDTECGRDGLAEAVQKAKSNKIWLGFAIPASSSGCCFIFGTLPSLSEASKNSSSSSRKSFLVTMRETSIRIWKRCSPGFQKR